MRGLCLALCALVVDGLKLPVSSRRAVLGAAAAAPLASFAPPSLAAGDVTTVRFDVQLSAEKSASFDVEVNPEWAPLGAERFLTLVDNGFYDDARFFRAIDGFVAQFGIGADPKFNAEWRSRPIKVAPFRARLAIPSRSHRDLTMRSWSGHAMRW